MLNDFLDKTCVKILFSTAFLVFSVIPAAAQTDILVSNDFEKDTKNWETRGDRVSIKSSNDQAATGTKSLKVTGRSDFWQGTQLNLTKILKKGGAYRFSAAVRLGKNDKSDTIKMTMQKGDGGFETVAAETVNADSWTTLTGVFKPTVIEPYLLVYFEAEGKNTSFYIDDFKIENLGDGIPAQTGVLLKNDFEDMTAQDWYIRGDAVQIFSSNAAGSQSLKVTGRAKNFDGVAKDVSPLIFKGRTYEFSVSVRLLNGQSKDSLKMTMQQTPPSGTPTYVEVSAPKEVTDAGWTTLTGKYTATTSDNNLVLYVESVNGTSSFFIDNFSISIPEKTATPNE